jgi:hypothetical protein
MNDNDENVVIVHDADVTNQYLQEYAERYHAAGGTALQAVSAVEPPRAAVSAPVLGPSPARSGFQLRFALADGGPVTVDLFGSDGRLVERVLDRVLDRGEQVVRWQAGAAVELSSGIYFVRLTTPAGVAERRLTVVR